jgi:hypothetical protein
MLVDSSAAFISDLLVGGNDGASTTAIRVVRPP